MIARVSHVQVWAAALALASVTTVPVTAGAQSSFLHRHHHLAGAAAGIGAYAAARHTGRNRTASGRHKNIFQRHPMATGVGAAIVANHMAKKHH